MRPFIWEHPAGPSPASPWLPSGWELCALPCPCHRCGRASLCPHLAQHLVAGMDADQIQLPPDSGTDRVSGSWSLALHPRQMLSLRAPDGCPPLGMCPLLGSSTAHWGTRHWCSPVRVPGTPAAVLGCLGTARLPPVTRPPAVTQGRQRGDEGRRWPGSPVSAFQGAVIQRQQ